MSHRGAIWGEKGKIFLENHDILCYSRLDIPWWVRKPFLTNWLAVPQRRAKPGDRLFCRWFETNFRELCRFLQEKKNGKLNYFLPDNTQIRYARSHLVKRMWAASKKWPLAAARAWTGNSLVFFHLIYELLLVCVFLMHFYNRKNGDEI